MRHRRWDRARMYARCSRTPEPTRHKERPAGRRPASGREARWLWIRPRRGYGRRAPTSSSEWLRARPPAPAQPATMPATSPAVPTAVNLERRVCTIPLQQSGPTPIARRGKAASLSRSVTRRQGDLGRRRSNLDLVLTRSSASAIVNSFGGASMAVSSGINNGGLGRDARGAAVAGLGTCALSAWTWWSARGGLPTPQVSAVILILHPRRSGVGSRVRPLPPRAALLGRGSNRQLARLHRHVFIDPSLPPPDSSFSGHELLNAAFLVPFIGGGHFLGAWAEMPRRRSLLAATVAGLPICVAVLYAWWDMPGDVARNPGAIALLVWVGSGIGAGLVSGRFRDAPASWAAAVVGFMVAYVAAYAIELGTEGPVEALFTGR